MPNIHLTLAGPPEAAYPNGGDEAYWTVSYTHLTLPTT